MFAAIFTLASAALALGVSANPVERQSSESHTVTVRQHPRIGPIHLLTMHI
jgi:hypothetical protein